MFQPTYSPDDAMPAALPARSPPSRSLLERLLSPLDWGRQAVVNFGQGVGDLGDGNFRSGLAKMAPGIGGLLAGALTGGIAAPFVGTGLASLLQGAGNEIAPTTMQAMSTSDLLTKLGGDPDSDLQNIALGAATDPWTYAFGMGGIAGGSRRLASVGDRVGGRIGEQVGQRLEAAQIARGPRYTGHAAGSDVMRALRDSQGGYAHDLSWSQLDRLAGEIPPGSVPMSDVSRDIGTNLFKTPDDRVIKMSLEAQGRPVSEGLVQPSRSALLPNHGTPPYDYGTNVLVEHMPFASPLAETETEAAERMMAEARGRAAGSGSTATVMPSDVLGPHHFETMNLTHGMDQTESNLLQAINGGRSDLGPSLVYADWLEEQGRPLDALRLRQVAEVSAATKAERAMLQYHPDIMGLVDGRPVLTSPGQFGYGLHGPGELSFHPVTEMNNPSLITRKMLDALGGDTRLQEALHFGHQNTGLVELLKHMGHMAGSMGGHAAGGLVGASAAALPVALRSELGY